MRLGRVLLILLAGAWVCGSLYAQSLDGRIDEGEYPFHAEFDDGAYVVHWRVEGDTVFFALRAATTGWVAIGLEPTQAMEHADMIFGWVTDSGKVEVVDAWSTDTYGPHPRDVEQGGRSDILAYGGVEQDGVTTIEFSRKTATGDAVDRDIPVGGELEIIWATGSEDDFEAFHESMGYGALTIGTGAARTAGRKPLQLVHAAVLSVAFLLMLSAAIISLFLKKRRWWLKAHRPMGRVGAILGVIGVGFGIYMVQVTSGVHFGSMHTYLGAITIIVIAATPLIGQAIFKIKGGKNAVRATHRWFGRLSLLLMACTIVVGLFKAGIL